MGGPLFVLRVSCRCMPVCSLFTVLSGDYFFSELKNMRGDAKKTIKSPEGKHLLAYQPLEDGENQQRPVRLYRNALG